MSSEKLILFLIAMVMVGFVLLLGYKIDKYDEKGKRREKIIEKRNNKKVDDFYDDLKLTENNYEEKQTAALGNVYHDFYKGTSENDKYSERFEQTSIIEEINLSKIEKIENDEKNILKDNENMYEESEIESGFDVEYEDDFYEDYDYEKANSSTMVFDVTTVKEELLTKVKDYDFEEDNVRSIKNEGEKPKTTRKTAIKKVEEKPKTTRKSTTKKVEEKTKTARKATTKKVEEKPKTARKSTTKKVEEKPKTTRKSTTKKVEEKPKTTRKSTAKKVEEKNKNNY